MRVHVPDCATLTIDGLEAPRYATFLNERIGSLRGLISGEHEGFDYEGRLVPALSWHACSWEGHDLELIVPPGVNGRTVIAVATSSGALHAFDRELKQFCDRPEGRARRGGVGQ